MTGQPRAHAFLNPGHQASADPRPEPLSPHSERSKPRNAAGTRGLRSRIPEHEVALRYALAMEASLHRRGWTVTMSRRSADLVSSNKERALAANHSGAIVAVNVHCNGVRDRLRWAGRLKRGCMTIVSADGADAAASAAVTDTAHRLAHQVQDALQRAIELPDRGVVVRNDLTSLNWSTIPALLLELGYLTHPEDEAVLLDPSRPSIVAEAIADVLDRFFAR